MRKQILLLLGFFLACCLMVPAQKVATFPELINPDYFRMDNRQIYFVEGTFIYIYSLKDFKLVKRFGKRGEGPREFLLNPIVKTPLLDVQTDNIVVHSFGKISLFSRNGDFKKEMKIPEEIVVSMQPLGKQKFVGMGFKTEKNVSFITINSYGPDLKKEKEIYKQENTIQIGEKIDPLSRPPEFLVSSDKIVINTGLGPIHILNPEGEKICSINHNYEKVKVRENDKKELLTIFRTDPRIKQYYLILKDRVEFPRYFPGILLCTANNNKIYVQTFKKINEKSQFYIFDMNNGKLLKKTFISIAQKTLIEPYYYNIYNGKIYQLIENEDEETWELHVIEIGNT
jgi:hypothetical protein